MATLRWEVPLSSYFEVCALLAEAHKLNEEGSHDKQAEISERIVRMPGYPNNRTLDDIVMVVPAGAKIYITPAPQGVN